MSDHFARAIIDAALVAVTRTPHGEHVLIDTREEDERESVTNAIIAALAKAGLEIRAAKHSWVLSTLGHGESMCSRCLMTNREAAVLGLLSECRGS